ncbi:MAG: RNA 2',3'-cyclic phosphodiesterase [Candidatus Pacebacteria bacterium]|nr:RNA 2',3'-cyclic phosphodiesterase [Candidatus Paceibacterota bacterium]
MLHRIFIAINLPEDIKSKLLSFQKKWPTLPCRGVKKENLHITLIFLGNLDDNQLFETINTSKEVAKRHKPFLVKLEKICFGPPKKFPPRMVWVKGALNQGLANLQKDLEDSIFKLSTYKYKTKGARPFSPHITLARIKVWEFRRLEDKPEIDEEIDLTFEVNSFEIMESFLKRSGAEYEILESLPLGNN